MCIKAKRNYSYDNRLKQILSRRNTWDQLRRGTRWRSNDIYHATIMLAISGNNINLYIVSWTAYEERYNKKAKKALHCLYMYRQKAKTNLMVIKLCQFKRRKLRPSYRTELHIYFFRKSVLCLDNFIFLYTAQIKFCANIL